MATTRTSSRTAGGRRQSKGVSFVYGGISGVLLLVIATIALVVQPPAPPALAEFAPQAEQRIEEAPEEQSSQFSNTGTGACAAGQQDCSEGGTGAGLGAGTTTSLPPIAGGSDDQTIIDTRRVRRCVGDPPRQIEDPQSPPCVAYWEGDNGGSTSKGVTRDEIRVTLNRQVHYQNFDDVLALTEFFNRRFEFYGRKIRLILKRDTGYDAAGGDLQAKAAAHTIEADPFAAIAQAFSRNVQDYRNELVRHGIISIMVSETATTEAELQRKHPYLWNYQMPYDRLGRDFAQFACNSLATPGATARYAGGVEQSKARKFAVIRQAGTDTSPKERMGDPSALIDGLKACNAAPATAEFDSTTRGAARAMLNDLRSQGVTSIIMVSSNQPQLLNLMSEASSIAYQPEWMLLGGGGHEHFMEQTIQQTPPDQNSHLMALMGWNKHLALSDRPATWAYDEVGIEPEFNRYVQAEAMESYQALLLLASGIQAAGPNLTPETFAKGLQGLKFPNPGAGGPPYYQAAVGFAGDHSMVEDEAIVWWSAAAPAYFSQTSETGGWCYVDKGARWRYGQWPKRAFDLFSPTADCR